jgi:hypothetical protein
MALDPVSVEYAAMMRIAKGAKGEEEQRLLQHQHVV